MRWVGLRDEEDGGGRWLACVSVCIWITLNSIQARTSQRVRSPFTIQLEKAIERKEKGETTLTNSLC